MVLHLSPLLRATRRVGRAALHAFVLLVSLISVERFHAAAAEFPGGKLLDAVVRTALTRDLNKEDRARATAGYYQDLLNEGVRASGRMLVTGGWSADWLPLQTPQLADRREVGGFLEFELKPNLDVDDARGRIVTNSYGMPDQEYPLDKPAGTRRIALLGDSIARGIGAPFGASFEALLERRLNACATTGAVRHVEILNFSVGGYLMTQILDLAHEKVRRFAPDVYVVAISDHMVARGWASHLTRLVHQGVDLKYPFLQTVAVQARLDPIDGYATADAKLSPFMLRTIEAILADIKAVAAGAHAALMVWLVHSVNDTTLLDPEFAGVERVAGDLHVPLLDLRDTFDRSELERFWVSEADRHPNQEGHRRIFENLYRKIRTTPGAFSTLLGYEPDADPVARACEREENDR